VRRPGGARLLGIALLGLVGLACVAAGLVQLGPAVAASVRPLREAATSPLEQRFTFDRRAWRAVAVDDLFPPVYHSTTAAPLLGSERDFTRIGLAQPADCRAALDPALVRLLSAHPCGPVLRAGYTDATGTLVATVGLAVLGTDPADEHEVSAATESDHDDLGAIPVAFPGTPAAGFGAGQRVAFRVLAADEAPFLTFAVVGFSDGRPAAADPGPDARDQSGAQLTAVDLEQMVDRRITAATDALWAKAR
jgi:hypothetical protein